MTSTMSGMPAPATPVSINGHQYNPQTPAAPAAPAAPASPGPTSTRRAAIDPRAERLRLIATKGRKIIFLMRISYIAVLIVAGIGQTTGLMVKLGVPWYIALVPMIATETMQVVFAATAQYRRQLGENAYVTYALAALLSGFAVVVNWWGHHDTNVGLAFFFSVFSALGFVVYMVESAMTRRDELLRQGKLDEPPPIYGLWLTLRQRRLVARAKEHYVDNPKLARGGSLAAARESLRRDARRVAIVRVVRADLTKTMGADNADLLIATMDLDELAEEIRSQAEVKRVGGIYGRRIDPVQIEAAHAVEDAERRSKTRGNRFGRRQAIVIPAPPVSGEPGTSGTGSGSSHEKINQKPRKGAVAVQETVQKRPGPETMAALRTVWAAHPDWRKGQYAQELGCSSERLRVVVRDFATPQEQEAWKEHGQ